MTSKVLVDTSAWIEFFRPHGDISYRELISNLIDDNEVALCGLIFLELLRGARSEKEYEELENRLATLFYLETSEILWKKAGRIGSLLLKKGIYVPSTDLMIGIIAVEHDIPLLHKDKHFALLEHPMNLQVYKLS